MSAFQNYFVNTIKNHYVDFGGRARRSQYWYFSLFSMLIILPFYGLAIFGLFNENSILTYLGGAVYIIAAFGLFLPSLGLTFRRLHDTGKSAWWLLIAFVPLIGSIVLLVFFCTDSQMGSNIYGPNPKNENEIEVQDHLIS